MKLALPLLDYARRNHSHVLQVVVVGDWSRCARGNFWLPLLADLDHRRLVPNEARVYPLADWVQRPAPNKLRQVLSGVPGRSLLEHLADCDVLILNWDVLNGDPDFGADLAMRWFAHRRPEILHWVREHPGLLIIEGQATLGVPSQAAYDALLGPSQLLVSGEAYPFRPRRQVERLGGHCRIPYKADSSWAFDHLHDLTAQSRTFDEMFPGSAGNLLSPYLSTGNWQLLYRGWFRWNPLRRSKLPWVPLIRTGGRTFNHPTLLAAKHGAGAVIVSTMLLAGSMQEELVEALLRCHQNNDSLPGPPRRLLFWKRWVLDQIIPVLAGGLAAAVASKAFTRNEVSALSLALVAMFGIAIAALVRLRSWIARWMREITGR